MIKPVSIDDQEYYLDELLDLMNKNYGVGEMLSDHVDVGPLMPSWQYLLLKYG